MSPALADGFFITRTTWVTHSTLYSLGQMTREAKQKLWKKENLSLDPQIEISSHLNKMALIVIWKRNPLSCDVWLVTFTSQVSFVSRLCCSSAPPHLPFSSFSLLLSLFFFPFHLFLWMFYWESHTYGLRHILRKKRQYRRWLNSKPLMVTY